MAGRTQYVIERMGDRVSDQELGLPAGTIEAAAEIILAEYDDIDAIPDDAWAGVVDAAIVRARAEGLRDAELDDMKIVEISPTVSITKKSIDFRGAMIWGDEIIVARSHYSLRIQARTYGRTTFTVYLPVGLEKASQLAKKCKAELGISGA